MLFVQNLLMGILSAFMLYAVFIVLYHSFSQYYQTFGILRSVGYRARNLFATIFLEFLLYWAQLVVTCYGIVFMVEYIYFPKFVYPYWDGAADGLPYILRTSAAQTGIFAAVTFALCLLAAALLTWSLGKKSISSAIRYSE